MGWMVPGVLTLFTGKFFVNLLSRCAVVVSLLYLLWPVSIGASCIRFVMLISQVRKNFWLRINMFAG